MRQFIVGLLTHHFVTKLVSLLLAIVLFVFVQQSISETQRIERLFIQFELDSDLDECIGFDLQDQVNNLLADLDQT